MIEADKLPAAAVDEPFCGWVVDDETVRAVVAHFLDALLADDAAMDRAWSAFHANENATGGTSHPRVPMRAALEAAVQEETG